MPEKVTEPNKIVTDASVSEIITEQGIDIDYVELWRDYSNWINCLIKDFSRD